MKINYKNTALGMIDDPRNFRFSFPPNMYSHDEEMKSAELEAWGRSLLKNGATLRSLVGHNIQQVSDTFWSAFVTNRHKLKDIFDKEPIEEAGALILSKEHGTFSHTYYYFVKTYGSGEEWDYDILFMDFSKHTKNDEPHLDVYISNHVKDKKRACVIWKQHLDDGLDNTHWESLIISFILFKKYCDIETKVVQPRAKATHANNKYVNETDKRITILDSTWFTNLVVTGAFNVGGHLRWQPYGPGLAQKKLIWISDYTKEGYTRKAKALTQNENTNNG